MQFCNKKRFHKKRTWQKNTRFIEYAFFFFIIVWSIVVLMACRENAILPNEVATQEKAAVSPSGKYILVVVSGYDGTVNFQSFQILDNSGETVYLSPERFGKRHTTYFLWGQNDRVWVYSGDVGTFFWEYNTNTGKWERQVYVQSNIPAPEFLKQMRPNQYNR